MITALVTATLSQVPVSRTTKNSNAMVTASLAVEVGDGKPAYVGLCAFGSEAETLLLPSSNLARIRAKPPAAGE